MESTRETLIQLKYGGIELPTNRILSVPST